MDRPKWNRGDTIKSIKDVVVIGAVSLKECIIDAADWLDTRFANKLNEEGEQ